MNARENLEGLIDELLAQRGQPLDASEAVVASGPWVEAMPMAVHLDPRLDPYDRSVFSALWALSKRRGGSAIMPAYEEIMRYAGIRSRDRVARSITALRITRWITLLERSRDRLGRNRGNAYLLNVESEHIADVLQLDREHIRFLRQTATDHRNRRLRTMALEELSQLDSSEDPTQPPDALDRLAGHLFWRSGDEADSQVRNTNSVPNHRVHDANSAGDRVQNTNSDSDRVHDANSVHSSGSSSDLYIKTTTTPPISPPSRDRLQVTPADFLWPDFLEGPEHENIRELLCRQLARLPEESRQPMLDELAGQMRYRRKQSDPIQSPVGYFCAMCNRFLDGDGGPGGHADAERKLRAANARVAQLEQAPVPAGPQAPASRRAKSRSPAECARAREYLSEMKAKIGIRGES